jgi:hypothetical protein
MAKADPRWKGEVPRRLPPRRGVEGLPAAAECGATLPKPPVAPAACAGVRPGTRRPGRCTRNPSRQRRGSRLVPASSARPRVPISRRRARRPYTGDGNQIQPDTRMRSSASDDPHRSAVGRSGRLGAESHLICMPQDADRHDAAIGADRQCARCSRRGLITQRDKDRPASVSCRLWAAESWAARTDGCAQMILIWALLRRHACRSRTGQESSRRWPARLVRSPLRPGTLSGSTTRAGMLLRAYPVSYKM